MNTEIEKDIPDLFPNTSATTPDHPPAPPADHPADEQRLREYAAFKRIETARAKERSGYRWDLVPDSARGDAEPPPGGSPQPLAALARGVGKARDLAAAKVGMVGSTAAEGEKVIAALDLLRAAEDHQGYRQLREALFKSIHAALTLGQKNGWIPRPAPRPKRVGQTVADAGAEHSGGKPDREPEDTDEPPNAHGPGGAARGLADAADVAGNPAPKEAPRPTPPTGSTLYRDRQLPTHEVVAGLPTPFRPHPAKTRHSLRRPWPPHPVRLFPSALPRPWPTLAKAVSPPAEKSLCPSPPRPAPGMDRQEGLRRLSSLSRPAKQNRA